jgi:stress response protein YsnF
VVPERPEMRQVGEVTIFPLVEERLVVTRELFLREEVHVRKVTSVVEKSAQFPLKRDVLVETRTETSNR